MCFHWFLKIRNWKQSLACFQFPSQIEFWKQFLFSTRFELPNKFFSFKNRKLFLKTENKEKKQLPNIPEASRAWYSCLCELAWAGYMRARACLSGIILSFSHDSFFGPRISTQLSITLLRIFAYLNLNIREGNNMSNTITFQSN